MNARKLYTCVYLPHTLYNNKEQLDSYKLLFDKIKQVSYICTHVYCVGRK